jgi:hypothetical protein
MSAQTCACGAVTSSPATHCGQPMTSKAAADQSAKALYLVTGSAKSAREKAAKR